MFSKDHVNYSGHLTHSKSRDDVYSFTICLEIWSICSNFGLKKLYCMYLWQIMKPIVLNLLIRHFLAKIAKYPNNQKRFWKIISIGMYFHRITVLCKCCIYSKEKENLSNWKLVLSHTPHRPPFCILPLHVLLISPKILNCFHFCIECFWCVFPNLRSD